MQKRNLSQLNTNAFTLIEMVAVLVVIGVLAGIVLLRYVNLSTTAYTSSVNSLAAALSTASADNYSKRSANSTVGTSIGNCTGISSLLTTGTLPSGYSITSAAITAGAAVTCTLTGPSSSSATFVGLGIN